MSAITSLKQKLSSAISWIPRKYQKTALTFILSNKRGALFLDPGLGKTSIILKAMSILLRAGESKGVLVIAPLRVCYLVWPLEILKWLPFNHLTSKFLHGKDKLIGTKKDIYFINPEGLEWLLSELLEIIQFGEEIPFDTLVVDESTKFKNHKAKTRFECLVQMLPLFKRRYILTGTPAAKGLLDLWAQIYILDEGQSLTGNYYHYRNKYFMKPKKESYNWVLKKGADDQIHKAIAHLTLDMSAKDNLSMPELIENDIFIELPQKAKKQYKILEREFFLELDGMGETVTAGAAAQLSMKCHQMANGRVYPDPPIDATEEEIKQFKKTRRAILIHDQKAKALQELAGELAGKPLLIAYHFKHDLEAIEQALAPAKIATIGSGVTLSQTLAIQAAWNAGELPFLAGQPQSMGHGLNLQESGTDILWYSLTWSLENYIQFIDRIYRSGVQGSQVRLHRFIAKDTVDQAIVTRLQYHAKEQISLREALREYRLIANSQAV